jgi:2-polyprenyl-3-methyl-5-hydroxy-6-metoxy-1,4-benzoquinol methylase
MSETATTSPHSSFDAFKQEAFIEKVLRDTSATMTTILASIGDRLGLFKDLSVNSASTSAEFAARTGIHERYAREWLGGMANAGYLEYDPATRRFRLPVEHAAALAQENGPFFFGGACQMIPAMLSVGDQVVEAFRKGGGVHQSAYPPAFWEGLERFSAGWFENLLLQQWIPAMPQVEGKLKRGATLADVGCGRGRAIVKLAQAFSSSRFVGYDVFLPAVEQATERARAAGVGDRVKFQQLDAAKGITEQYDVITTFDVVHDAADPLGLLRAIRQALRPDGRYVCLDVNCSDKLEENAGPLGAMFHGVSIFYCMTTSLANGGAGLGTLGFHEPKVRELCAGAGFSSVRRVPLENPFNILYEIEP